MALFKYHVALSSLDRRDGFPHKDELIETPPVSRGISLLNSEHNSSNAFTAVYF